MALLTADDVYNKKFTPTRRRSEGYDQDEVDDFLDEIVLELRRLNQENADLREQLENRPAAAAAPAAGPAQREEPQGGMSAAPVGVPAGQSPQPAPQPAQPVKASSSSGFAASGPGQEDSAQSAAGVLAMAQKLHDQYVNDGKVERDRLIAEGRAKADNLVNEAQSSKAQVLDSLQAEKRSLEASVSHLRSFESSYRERLSEFISGQLREIKQAPSLAPEQAAQGNRR